MNEKNLVIKKCVKEDYYLVEVPSTNPADNGKLVEAIMHKADIQRHLGVDEKELSKILTQI